MSLWQEFFKDPVIFISFVGLAIVIGLCVFYGIFFYKKVQEAEKKQELTD